MIGSSTPVARIQLPIFGIEVNIEAPIGRDGHQAFRDEQVEFFVVSLERGESSGITVLVKCSAQRVIMIGLLAEACDALVAALPYGREFGGLGLADRVANRVPIRKKRSAEVGIAENVDDEDDQDESEKRARNFHDSARTSPAAAFFVVENWLAITHGDNPS